MDYNPQFYKYIAFYQYFLEIISIKSLLYSILNKMRPFLITYILIFLINTFCFLYYFLTNSYPWITIMVQIISMCILFFTILSLKKILHFIYKHQVETIIGFILFLATFILYLFRLDKITPGMWGDEVSVGLMSENLYKLTSFTPFVTDNMGHPTPQLYIIGWIIKTFGRTVVNIRFTSVLFGSLNAALFYLYLRLFNNKKVAIGGAILLLNSYVHIAVSRFAYEMSIAIFFELLFLIFLFLYQQKNIYQFLVVAGFSLGFGLYTYLGFRTFALISFFYCLFMVIKSNALQKNKIISVLLFISAIIIPLFSLINYGLYNPTDLMIRTKSVSLFHQNYSPLEVKKELWGNINRTLGMFVSVGDPNPRQNPAQTTPFDPITLILFGIGIIYLIKFGKKKWIFFIFVFFVPSLLNDILSVERIPEFHYYGLGHPNTLRISGILPLIYVGCSFGLSYVSKLNNKYGNIILTSLIIIISIININRYYNQTYLPFNHVANKAPMLTISKLINQSKIQHIFVSSSIYNDQRIQYFVPNYSEKLKKITLQKNDCIYRSIPKEAQLIILFGSDNPDCITTILKSLPANSYSLSYLTNPFNTADAVMLTRKE